MGKYEKHKRKWIDCKRCSLCERRTNVVLLRGKLPCDVMFVGEAPGVSEDVLGRPFVGPAGKLLDAMIERAFPSTVTYCITNLVGCIPKDETGSKVSEPPKKAITECGPRLLEVYKMASPGVIVCVGTLAKKWVPKILGSDGNGNYKEITHPAAILRMGVEQQGYAIQLATITLADIAEELIPF